MAGYLGSVPVPQATQHRESFTCTEGQTSFATAGYTAQFVDVYLNGSHLSPADFTATNGSDVVLAVAASADDVCDIISYTPFEVADQTFTGTTTIAAVDVTGVATASTFEPDGDTAAGDNAAIGYTAAEGLILTGQGSTNDITIKNDADADVIEIPTGTVNVTMAGTLATASTITVTTAASTKAGSFVGNGIEVKHPTGASNLFIGTQTGNDVKIAAIGAQSMRLDTNGVARLIIDSTGAVTMPLQPAFSINMNNTDQANIAEGGTATYVKWTHARFDQNSDFTAATGNGQGADGSNLIGVFTAPVTGKYQLQTSLRLDAIDSAATYYIITIGTSNENYQHLIPTSLLLSADPDYMNFSFSVLADMDASDTASVQVIQQDGSVQTEIEGDVHYTRFSGYLVA